jgi:hypothetical protein
MIKITRPSELLWRQSPELLEGITREALSVALKSHNPEKIAASQTSLAYTLLYQGKPAEARDLVRAALEALPGYAEALWCEAQLAMFLDDWPAAWAGLEARFLVKYSGERPIPLEKTWDGSALNGRPILFAGEGGLGDQIQFVRFASALRAAGAGHVTVSANPALIPLFDGIAEMDSICTAEPFSNKPSCPCHVGVPMLSVPFLLGTTLKTLPNKKTYLSAPAGRTADARLTITPWRRALNVGLCWRSKVAYRCAPLSVFRPLLDVKGIRLFGIGQRAEIEQDIADFPDFPIVNVGTADLEMTAAILTELDVTITIDTVTAHLAGALGLPIWTLLHEVPDWRWGLRGETTPWYPSMRLFRQEQRSWTRPIERVVDGLSALA